MTKDGLSLILRAADNSPWREDVITLLDAPGKQALKAWLADKQTVETLQVTVSGGHVTRAWAPGPRTVDTQSRKGGAFFADSFREYAGVTATASTETLWAGFNADMLTHIIYRVV